jgi:hypothetical protein
MKRKQFMKGITQIAQEGAIQVFQEFNTGMEEIIVGVVGVLQFEVLKYRLENEYNVEIKSTLTGGGSTTLTVNVLYFSDFVVDVYGTCLFLLQVVSLDPHDKTRHEQQRRNGAECISTFGSKSIQYQRQHHQQYTKILTEHRAKIDWILVLKFNQQVVQVGQIAQEICSCLIGVHRIEYLMMITNTIAHT